MKYSYTFTKNKWSFIFSDTAKKQLAPSFVNLVQSAYAKTPQGSFINSVTDVLPSKWIALDWDNDPEPDSVIFYRTERSNEPWKGFKIQGIGHDTQRTSIDMIFKKLKYQLNIRGWWIEASDAMEHILYKDKTVKYVKDWNYAAAIFPNTNLTMLNMTNYPGKYSRKTSSSSSVIIKESIFGKPVLKKTK